MSRIPDDAPVFSMAVVEKMTGLTRRRIRYYEKVGLLDPARTEGNRRLYSPAEVRRLSEIKRLLEEGLDLQGIAALVESERRAGRAPDRFDQPARPQGALAGRGPMEVRALERYEDARARLLGKGPAGSLDRLHPGDAGCLARPVPRPETPPRPGQEAGTGKPPVKPASTPYPRERRR